MGLFGKAQVLDILPCPDIEQGAGRVVLTTVTTLSGYIYRLTFEGSDEVLQPTRLHRLFSEDRQDWIPTQSSGDMILNLSSKVGDIR